MRSSLHIVSWNVASWPTTAANICKLHGSVSTWLDRHKVDILCLQEVKATRQKMVLPPSGWKTFLAPCIHRPGLNGVATLVRDPFPTLGADIDPLQSSQLSGRCILTEHGAFTLINVYVPYDGENGIQLEIKIEFLTSLLSLIRKIQKSGRSVICVGDFNVARHPRDVYYEFRKIDLDGLSQKKFEPHKDAEVNAILALIQTEWQSNIRAKLMDRRIVEISNGSKNGPKFALKIGNIQIGQRQSSANACEAIANPSELRVGPHIYKEEGIISISDFFEIVWKIEKKNFSIQSQMIFSDLYAIPRSPPEVLLLWDQLVEECNMVDSYIESNPAGRSIASERFTCWDQYRNERYENKGARIDYCLVDKKLVPAIPKVTSDKYGSLIVSSDRDLALKAATAESRWQPVPFSGGGVVGNIAKMPIEFEFLFSNPPHTGIIYTPPLFSDHVATSLILEMGLLPHEGINERAKDELGTQWKNTMASALVSPPTSLKSMFLKHKIPEREISPDRKRIHLVDI